VASARAALRAQADPNRPLIVVPAVECLSAIGIVLRVDPSYVAASVYAAVKSVLVDDLFAPGGLALGETLYRSRIERLVTDVPGVRATHNVRMLWFRNGAHFSSGPRFAPGDGGFFSLTADHVFLTEEVDADD
jgi:hypothetical protein